MLQNFPSKAKPNTGYTIFPLFPHFLTQLVFPVWRGTRPPFSADSYDIHITASMLYNHVEMSVDLPPSYPVNTAISASKPVDVQSLQNAFAGALRNYGTETGVTTTNTMLEVVRPAPRPNDTANDDKNQLRREQQQYADRNNFTNLDRKLLDKSEARGNEMNSDYRNRTDRTETLRNDHWERIEQGERQQSAVLPSTSSLATTSLDVVTPNEPVQSHGPSFSQNVPATTGTNGQSLSVNVPNSVPSTGQTTNVAILGGNGVPVSISRQSAPSVIPPHTFTVFTPLGRFGQAQKKVDEKEKEDEELVDEQDVKKHQPFALFEAIQTEATRIVRHNRAQKPKRPVDQPFAEKVREKPKEIEVDFSRNVKTIEELLNTSPQSVVASKKGEQNQSNQTPYLNRVAAACEAASHYAPIRIKINLDHLGTLTLRFFYRSDKLTLRFEVPSKESAEFLQDHLGDLRTMLSKRNVEIAHVEMLWDS